MKTNISPNGDKYLIYEDNEECDHRGCRAHLSHPCEKCGRVGAVGRANILVNPMRLEE